MDEHAFECRIVAAAGGEDGRESAAKVADLAVLFVEDAERQRVDAAARVRP